MARNMLRLLFQLVLVSLIWMGTGFDAPAQSFPITLQYDKSVAQQNQVTLNYAVVNSEISIEDYPTNIGNLNLAALRLAEALRYHSIIGLHRVKATLLSSQILPKVLSSVLPG